MNGLFRIAFRTLCWGLIVAVSVTTVVMAKGIPPDVMVTFQRKADPQPEMIAGTNPRLGDEEPQPPEFYARAETPSRLDVPGESGFAASQRPTVVSDQPKPGRLKQSKTSLSVAPSLETDTSFEPEPPHSPNSKPDNYRLPPPASELDAPEEAFAPVRGEAKNDSFEPTTRSTELNEPAGTQPPADTNGSQALNNLSMAETASIEQEASSKQSAPQNAAVQTSAPPEVQAPSRQLDQEANADSAPAALTTELPQDPSAPRRKSLQPAIEKTVDTQETPKNDGETLQTKPMSESQPVFPARRNPPESSAESPKTSKSEAATVDSAVVDRLTQMQHQLDQIALKQQQDRDSAQSLFETSQLHQQRRIEQKLQGVEKGLRELRSERSLAAATPSVPASASLPTVTSRRTASAVAHPVDPTHSQVTSTTDTSILPLVKEEKPGPDGEKRYSVNSQHGDLRELLDALAQKADLKLVLAINVAGNVELNLRSVTADEALEAIKNSTGYAVEKSGRKVYVSQPVNSSNQRPVFLPPIIRPAKDRGN